jgi:hypothetical protein
LILPISARRDGAAPAFPPEQDNTMTTEMPKTLDYGSGAALAVQQLMECTAADRARHGQIGITARTSTAVLAAWTQAFGHERDRNASDEALTKALIFAVANLCASGHAQIFEVKMPRAVIDSMAELVRQRLHTMVDTMQSTPGVIVATPEGSA